MVVAKKRAPVKRAPVKPKKGDYVWHIHHKKLVEKLTFAISTRIKHIKSYKLEKEQATRLRWMTRVRAQAAVAAILKPKEKLYGYAPSWYANSNPTLDAIHKKEHPRCPWNGHTIFPRKRS